MVVYIHGRHNAQRYASDNERNANRLPEEWVDLAATLAVRGVQVQVIGRGAKLCVVVLDKVSC